MFHRNDCPWNEIPFGEANQMIPPVALCPAPAASWAIELACDRDSSEPGCFLLIYRHHQLAAPNLRWYTLDNGPINDQTIWI